MRVGMYVDGFNLYYGARGLCGRGTAGWRWLDLRALAADLARSACELGGCASGPCRVLHRADRWRLEPVGPG
jgi:hypothetical protein